jgi:hypothetical protein
MVLVGFFYNWVKYSLLCEIFVIEKQMIVVDQSKYTPFSFENTSNIRPFLQDGEERLTQLTIPACTTTCSCRIA